MKFSVYPVLIAAVVAASGSIPLTAVAQTSAGRQWTLDVSSCPAVLEFFDIVEILDPGREPSSATLEFKISADGRAESVALRERTVSARLARWVRMNFRTCTFVRTPGAGGTGPGTAVVMLDANFNKEATVGNGKLRCDLSSLSRELAHSNHRDHILIRVQTGPDSVPREVAIEESSNSESIDRTVEKLAMNCRPTSKASPNESILVNFYLERRS